MSATSDGTLTPTAAMAWMRRFEEKLVLHKDELARLDAAAGDADHGVSMERGGRAVRRTLGGHPPTIWAPCSSWWATR